MLINMTSHTHWNCCNTLFIFLTVFTSTAWSPKKFSNHQLICNFLMHENFNHTTSMHFHIRWDCHLATIMAKEHYRSLPYHRHPLLILQVDMIKWGALISEWLLKLLFRMLFLHLSLNWNIITLFYFWIWLYGYVDYQTSERFQISLSWLKWFGYLQ